MDKPLLRSVLFSIGVHAFFLLPAISFWRGSSLVQTDVLRGESAVELELLPALTESTEAGEEELESLKIPPKGSWLNDEGAHTEMIPSSWKNPAPRYPWMARVQGWEGTVLIEAQVNALGRVEKVQVTRSSGFQVLDQAALQALYGWQFVPAHRQGEAVAAKVEIPITFELQNREVE